MYKKSESKNIRKKIVCSMRSVPNLMMGSGQVWCWLGLVILSPELVINQKQSVKSVCVTCVKKVKGEATLFYVFISLFSLLINKYSKHRLTIIRCQSQRLIWRRSESYNVLLSFNENK